MRIGVFKDSLFHKEDGVTDAIRVGTAIHTALEKKYFAARRRYAGRMCISEELRKLLRKDGFAVTRHSAWTPSGRKVSEQELRQLGVFLETALAQEESARGTDECIEFYSEQAHKSWLSLGSLIGDILRSP